MRVSTYWVFLLSVVVRVVTGQVLQQSYQLRIGGNGAGTYTNGYVAMLASGGNNYLAVASTTDASLKVVLNQGVLTPAGYPTLGGYISAQPNKAPFNFGVTGDSSWSQDTNGYLQYTGLTSFAICNASLATNVLFLDTSVGTAYGGSACTPVVIVLVPAGGVDVAATANISIGSAAATTVAAANVSVAAASSISTAAKPTTLSTAAASVNAAAASVNVSVAVTIQATALTQYFGCACASNKLTSVLPGQIITITNAGVGTLICGATVFCPRTVTLLSNKVTYVTAAPATLTLAGNTVTTLLAPACGGCATVATYGVSNITTTTTKSSSAIITPASVPVSTAATTSAKAAVAQANEAATILSLPNSLYLLLAPAFMALLWL